MENSQKEIIRKNLPELLKNTECNIPLIALLLSQGHISLDETKELVTNTQLKINMNI